jgi:hypothetical protein
MEKNLNEQSAPQSGVTLLKITRPNGVTDYVPDNKANLDFHKSKKSFCTREKQARYLIERVTLTEQEAAELGFVKPSNKPVQRVTTQDTLAALLAQNAELIKVLTGEKQAKKSAEKGGQNG